jgi:hypothetical protein
MKKQSEVSAAAVPAVKTSATDDKASTEGANSLAIISSTSTEIIHTVPEKSSALRKSLAPQAWIMRRRTLLLLKKTSSGIHLYLYIHRILFSIRLS